MMKSHKIKPFKVTKYKSKLYSKLRSVLQINICKVILNKTKFLLIMNMMNNTVK